MPKQLTLDFTDAERPAESSPQMMRRAELATTAVPVAEIAEALRPLVLAYLRQADGQVGIHELRTELGHPGLDTETDPQSNPVNRILKELRDREEVICHEPEWGDPSFSLPVEIDSRAAPPLVRPDRQITFDGAPHYEWPKPEEDHDTITVDRLRDDIDGPAHRFVVRRGDRVEAFFRRDKTEAGEVVGISHARREVSVRFAGADKGIWFAVGCIYPAAEASVEHGTTAPLSAIVEQASQPPAGGFTEADRVPAVAKPFHFADYRTFLERLDDDQLTIAELKAEFARLTQSHDEFVAALQKDRTADQLKRMAGRFGCFDANRNSKKKNAEHVYRVVLQGFTLSEAVSFQPMKETIEEAVTRIVDGLSAEDLAKHIAQRKREQEDHEQAVSDPQTLEQFRIYLRQHSYRDLSSEQQQLFDRLHADQTRPARRERRRNSTVNQIETDGAEGLEIKIIEGFHTKHQIPLWICQLSTRVDRSTYNELKIKAKQLGGSYSSFVKGQEGFQFKTADAAQRFQQLLAGDVDRTDILADRKARKMESASDRLGSVAETLEREAAEILDADDGKLKNTVRRAEMAAGMRGRAYADRAMARTLHSISGDLAGGDANYLDGLRARTHVETLITVLRRAKRDRNTELMKEHESDGMWERHNAREEFDNRPMAVEDVAFAEYPYPHIYKRHLEEAVAVARTTHGQKQRARRMESHLVCTDDYVPFVDEDDVAFLQEFVDRIRGWTETSWIESGMEDYKRLRAADIHTPHEMRCALRELLPHLQRKQEDDPIQKLEQQLIGRKIPGFFPTPRPIISRMLELAGIQPGEHVLEPSAGKGDILDMLREYHPDAKLHGIECNATLLEILAAKGHEIEQGNFLEHNGQYDVLIMNPPFENGQEIEHVQHGFEQLADGGRLVAVMSVGPFFRTDKKAEQFRTWLEELDHDIEDLPDDAFQGVEAFRQTGVRTKLLTITK